MRKKITLALLSLLLVPLTMMAQNVTISPSSGNMIAGLAGGNTQESGKVAGFYSTWVHKQLALTVNTSDVARLTSAGDVADPACTLTDKTYNGTTAVASDHLMLANGNTQTFMVVSLPKGYRITGYKIVLQPDLKGKKLTTSNGDQAKNFQEMGDEATCFYETEAWGSNFPYYNNSQQYGTDHLALENYLAVATASDGDKIMNPSADANKTFTISRTAHQDDDGNWDMGNRLYFWVGYGTSYYGFSINSFEIFFTAEGTFDAEVTPSGVGQATNYIQTPFTTSKTDLGAVTWNSTLGRYIYTYENVRDIKAYMHLYQEDAVDETNGYPVVATSGTITPVEVNGEGHFAFGNNTYYIEPPTLYNTPSGISNQPVGFRVVGATFTPLWADAVTGGTQNISSSCYIYRSTTNGYLTASLDMGIYRNNNYSTNTRATWQFDEYGNMYLETNGYRQYLACYGEGNIRQLSLSSNSTGDMARWNLRRDSNGRIYYKSDGNKYYYLYTKSDKEGGSNAWRGYLISDGVAYPDAAPSYYSTTSSSSPAYDYTAVTSTTNGSQTITLPSFNPGKYTVRVYNAKANAYQDIVIDSEDDTDIGKAVTFDASKTGFAYNNDAVKFQILNLPTNCQALVDVTLQLEALNPYIDRMTVVCSDDDASLSEPLRITQTFTASDFGVNGGAFHFELPSECAGHDLDITFEDLFSHYGDETYNNGEGNARYSFVTSPYFLAFDGVKDDQNENYTSLGSPYVDSASDLGLYDTRYVGTDKSQPGADFASTHKIYTGVAGTLPFKFNNAEILSASTNQGTTIGTFTEYAFSAEKYLAKPTETFTDGSTGTGGEFKSIVMNTDEASSGTYYLFTADETRYNIAPTTAWEHRSYAFYSMDVTVATSTYEPQVEFKPIYTNTCHVEDGKDTSGAFYGAVVTTTATGGGYASTDKIFERISAITGVHWTQEEIDAAQEGDPAYGKTTDDWKIEPEGIDDAGNTDLPADSKHLLYLDFSSLAGILQVTTSTHGSMEDYSATNAPNCLVFLPKGSSAPNNNVAFKTGSGTFQAAHSIVLTDKQPFYSPYDIDVDATEQVVYKRDITWEKYGATTKQSLILPFELVLSPSNDPEVDNFSCSYTETTEAEDGSSTSTTTNTSLKVTTLSTEAFVDDATNSCVAATFAKVSGNKASANTPYMVDISSPSDGTFIIAQKGGSIKATTAMKSDYMFYDTKVTVNYNGETHEFYPRGSFSGKIYDRDVDKFATDNVFFYYGSKDMFRSSATLSSKYQKLYAYPFRSFYGYTAPSNSSKLAAFMFSYGSEETDGISDIAKRIDFAVQSGKGYIQITTGKDSDVRIFTLNGMKIANELMSAGESRKVSLPSGVYIVNGMKVIVK